MNIETFLLRNIAVVLAADTLVCIVTKSMACIKKVIPVCTNDVFGSSIIIVHDFSLWYF